MGSKLISKEIIVNKDYAKLEQDVKNALAIVKAVRK
jgi:2-dehydro-3-deoxyphosphogluconate aldolase/(4S)-4-hydroxy-2-oxoglutarate aldolase